MNSSNSNFVSKYRASIQAVIIEYKKEMKKVKEENNLTYRAISKASGLSMTTVFNAMSVKDSGVSTPTLRTVLAIAEAMVKLEMSA